MQIVIDIDEDTYRYMQSRCKYQNKGDKGLSKFEEAGVAIKNGTPLPKRHGDLIDREELKKYAGWYNLATDKSIHAVLTSELYQIEPVIPADGGDAE